MIEDGRPVKTIPDDVDAFRKLVDALPVMIWQQDAAGAMVFANAAWFEMSRLPREASSYATESWRRTIHPDDMQLFLAAFQDAIPKREPYSIAYRGKRAGDTSNAYRWFYATAKPQWSDDTFLGWFGSIVDIQDTRNREDYEQRLRDGSIRSEREFRAFGEAIPQIAWTADASGSIDWYNHGWYDYTGQTVEQASGWGWQAVHHPDDFQEMMRRWTGAIARGERVEMEFRMRGRDGGFRWFLTLINPLKDEHGNVLRWFGTNTDIHEQKLNVERSKRIAQTLQEVFLPDQLPDHPHIAFDAVYVPAESDALVGGDWYDAFVVSPGKIVVSIGDVAGHGLDAAVIAGRLRQTIFAEALTNGDPAAVLVKADLVLRAQSDVITTALVAFIDVETGEIRYASAGHPTPIVARDGVPARFLEDASAPLGTGFIPGVLNTACHRYELTPNETMLLYTDGITEFDRDVVAGSEALLRAVDRMVGARTAISARQLLEGVLRERPTADDIAMLLVRWKPLVAQNRARETSLKKQWRFHSSHALSAQTSRITLMSFVARHAKPGADLFETEIILGELLANTVEHAPGLVEITIDWTFERPTVFVRDSGAGFQPKAAHLPAGLSEDGRGIYLVYQLSPRVVVRAAQGYGTEFEVDLPIERAPSDDEITTTGSS